jgi:DNA-binding IclR family transcriptional regulator
MVTKVASDRQGIQSVEVGFRLLKVLAATNRPMMLRDIAKGAGMPAAKAHRYMVSFLRIGIVEQDASSGRYDLGAYALELGLSGLGRLDPVRLSGPILESLCEEIHETVALAVWGTHGATIVRIVDAGGPDHHHTSPGHHAPCATPPPDVHLPPSIGHLILKRMLDEEFVILQKTARQLVTTVRRQFEKKLLEIRSTASQGLHGSLTPGINGFSAPVYDHTGKHGGSHYLTWGGWRIQCRMGKPGSHGDAGGCKHSVASLGIQATAE